ncbi:MAG: hypothetical protein NTU76_00585 [Candidatus Taylorbacteria bacterium]|nr:hypothetical protein [Candidatus Taylorbacteria bacterium]
MDYTTLIPPAIALSVLIFSDDRDWEIELNGFYFVLNVISWAVVGVAFAVGLKIDLWNHLLNLFVLTFITLTLSAKSRKMANKFFDLKLEATANKTDAEKNIEGFFEKVGDKISIKFIFPILLIVFFVVAKDFISTNIFWMVTFSSQTFIIIFYTAFIYSLNISKLQKVNVYFINPSIRTLKNVTLLKVNSDNIKLRDGEKLIILNKSIVLKIESVIMPKTVPKEENIAKKLDLLK